MKQTLTILLLSIIMIGCSEFYPTKSGKFIIVTSVNYEYKLNKYKCHSIESVYTGFYFIDSFNKYSIGDTVTFKK